MIQNLIALIIVFSAAAITVFSIIKSLTAKKTSHCGGCTGCSFNGLPAVKHSKGIHTGYSQSPKLMFLKNGT